MSSKVFCKNFLLRPYDQCFLHLLFTQNESLAEQNLPVFASVAGFYWHSPPPHFCLISICSVWEASHARDKTFSPFGDASCEDSYWFSSRQSECVCYWSAQEERKRRADLISMPHNLLLIDLNLLYAVISFAAKWEFPGTIRRKVRQWDKLGNPIESLTTWSQSPRNWRRI